MMKISKKVAGVEYAIRDIVSAAREIELQGKTVDYLNIGDPVQSGFQPPQNVKQAMIDAINNGNNYYTRSEGLVELTDAIAKKENKKGLSISSENILVTNGVSEGLDMVISSIVEEGDEVLLPGPYYPPYASYVRLHGGIPIEFSVDLNSSSPDIYDIKNKNPDCYFALEQYTDHLARGLSLVCNILDPDVIVLGGGMSNIDFIYENIDHALEKYVFTDTLHTKVVKNLHGDSSGVRGAAWLS